jgi:hypothetical protein
MINMIAIKKLFKIHYNLQNGTSHRNSLCPTPAVGSMMANSQSCQTVNQQLLVNGNANGTAAAAVPSAEAVLSQRRK